MEKHFSNWLGHRMSTMFKVSCATRAWTAPEWPPACAGVEIIATRTATKTKNKFIWEPIEREGVLFLK